MLQVYRTNCKKCNFFLLKSIYNGEKIRIRILNLNPESAGSFKESLKNQNQESADFFCRLASLIYLPVQKPQEGQKSLRLDIRESYLLLGHGQSRVKHGIEHSTTNRKDKLVGGNDLFGSWPSNLKH